MRKLALASRFCGPFFCQFNKHFFVHFQSISFAHIVLNSVFLLMIILIIMFYFYLYIYRAREREGEIKSLYLRVKCAFF